MSADHSPTPWVLKDHGAVFDAEGGYVCDFAIGTYVNKKANARLMVQAVNAHDELVAALRLSLAALSHESPSSCWATGPLTGDPIEDFVVCPGCRAIHAIDAALAKVKGA